ncbi:MAG TPA: SRPBCC family protein [Candidatus Corynebacterium avicola]|uniref:SRPBCC family protein n=1 Tax=Candidatus Corynebacterium avicola TaxID=2838527 RepID=A0A9D1RN75_9CORY|nr:SRPBCC family protein [Candidatus Corynebacterium avicola]
MAYELSDSITVAASPADVHALVSDITRTGEWSAQCHQALWDDPATADAAAGSRVGATFTGHNRTEEREWTTVSEVTVDEPGVEFSWKVTSSGTEWGFRMEAVNRRDDATVLTEFTRFTEQGEAYFVEKYGEDAAAQEAQREEAATYGITETLHAIRGIIED